MSQKNKKPAKQSVRCSFPFYNLEYHDGKDINLPPNETYSMEIRYPFTNPPIFVEVKTGKNGMGIGGLFKAIWKAYDVRFAKLYLGQDGSALHSVEELFLEGIDVDHKKRTIGLLIGS